MSKYKYAGTDVHVWETLLMHGVLLSANLLKFGLFIHA